MDEMIKYLKALVFLQIHELSNQSAFEGPEVLLSKAGFSNKEIADVLGKTQNSVAITLHRIRKHKSSK